jgi:hypothetical protein
MITNYSITYVENNTESSSSKYVAQITGSAGTRLSNIDKANEEMQTENYITF